MFKITYDSGKYRVMWNDIDLTNDVLSVTVPELNRNVVPIVLIEVLAKEFEMALKIPSERVRVKSDGQTQGNT